MIPKLSYINGYGKRYIITSTGAVFSTKNGKGFGSRGIKLMSTRESNSGYEMIKLCSITKPKLCTIHRLVALAFVPNPHNKPLVNHIDGNKSNNNADNLEWVTDSENLQHAYMNGLMSHKGGKNSMAKLKEADINPIRQRIKSGELFYKIAKDYGVHYSIISGIAYDKIWTHVPKIAPPEKQLEAF